MKRTHFPNNGMIAVDSQGRGEVSGEMVWARSEELGKMAGRPMNNVDYGQALRELTGAHKMNAKESVSEVGRNRMHRAAKASEKMNFSGL